MSDEMSVMVDGEDFSTEGQESEEITIPPENEAPPQAGDEQGEQKPPAEAKETQEPPQPPKKEPPQAKEEPIAIHQQLEAERAKLRQYEAFLNDPQKVRAYLEELEREKGVGRQAEGQEEEIRPEQIQTVEDVQRYLAQERAKDRRELEQLKQVVAQFAQTQGILALGDRIRSEIAEVRRKYPELDPNNPAYNEELEKALGETYEELDFDPATQTFRGQVSLVKLADRFMAAAKHGEREGSRRAQTNVVDRRLGRVRSGGTEGGEEVDESALSPSQTIAARMTRVYRKIR